MLSKVQCLTQHISHLQVWWPN